MNISTLIPNDEPLFLRQKLIDASAFVDARERRYAIDAVTEDIRQRHPGLFWSEEELVVMQKAWATARAIRLQKAARDAELARLINQPAGADREYA